MKGFIKDIWFTAKLLITVGVLGFLFVFALVAGAITAVRLLSIFL